MSKRASPADESQDYPVSVWRSDAGEVIACTEKIKVLNENFEELRQMVQDALEDGLLMGCSEVQLRGAFHALIDNLINPYAETARKSADEK